MPLCVLVNLHKLGGRCLQFRCTNQGHNVRELKNGISRDLAIPREIPLYPYPRKALVCLTIEITFSQCSRHLPSNYHAHQQPPMCFDHQR